MGKTKIEWCDFTVNPIKGLCPVGCDYCYARRMYKRFKWNPRIEWDEQCLIDIRKIKTPSRIFVGSTMELFGEWVPETAMGQILGYCGRDYPQHTFIFLTKKPENLVKYSPFPPNCWVGVSITDNCTASSYVGDLANIKATVKFVSIEPLLNWVDNGNQRQIMPDYLKKYGINWLIVGQQWPQTAKTLPKIAWIQEIIHATNAARIPVFLKNNLKGFLPFAQFEEPWAEVYKLRQEYPKGV